MEWIYLAVGFAVGVFVTLVAVRSALKGLKREESPKYHVNEIIEDAIRTDERYGAGAFAKDRR